MSRSPSAGLFLLAGSFLLPLACTRARAMSLTVTVAGLHDNRGHVRIGVCERAEFLGERCAYHAVVPSRPGSVTATISGIRPGVYAVAAYQDSTDAGHLRRSFLGIPEDGIGFSRNPPLGLGGLPFDRCALSLGRQDAAITVTLRFF